MPKDHAREPVALAPPRPVPRRPSRSAAWYWLVDWPRFVLQSAGAWYFTLIGLLGGACVLLVLAILVLWFGFGIRWGW